jgi:hypothetical protein
MNRSLEKGSMWNLAWCSGVVFCSMKRGEFDPTIAIDIID